MSWVQGPKDSPEPLSSHVAAQVRGLGTTGSNDMRYHPCFFWFMTVTAGNSQQGGSVCSLSTHVALEHILSPQSGSLDSARVTQLSESGEVQAARSQQGTGQG